jgi:putative SOS response-associated peptidase YedK
MCGRFIMVTPFSVIAQTFGIEEADCDLHPSYNIPPGNSVLAVIREKRESANRLVRFRWGLVPAWAKAPAIGNRLINARAESVHEKPSFKEAFRKRRCLVIADGFYEWQRKDGKRIPFFVRLKNKQPFGFAGLYETWTSPAGRILKTCTIITTQANELVKPLHDRMPVIVPENQRTLWLDPAINSKEILFDLLKPYPAENMETYEVSRSVNSPTNDTPDLIRPPTDR